MKPFTFAGDYFGNPSKMEVHDAAFGVEVFKTAISVNNFHSDLKILFLDIVKAIHKGSDPTLEILNMRLADKIDQLSESDLDIIIKNNDNLNKLEVVLDIGRMVIDLNLNTEIKNTLGSIETITQENKKSLQTMENVEKNIERLTSENIVLLKASEQTGTNIKLVTWILAFLTLSLIVLEVLKTFGPIPK